VRLLSDSPVDGLRAAGRAPNRDGCLSRRKVEWPQPSGRARPRWHRSGRSTRPCGLAARPGGRLPAAPPARPVAPCYVDGPNWPEDGRVFSWM